MTTVSEINRQMAELEEEARRVLANPQLTTGERRQALEHLLRRYNVLDDYRRALAAYLRRMRWQDGGTAEDPEAVLSELLASPEFALLRAVVLAALLAALYSGGPRAALVPVALLVPTMTPPFAVLP